MKTPILETQRLILRPVSAKYAQDVYNNWTSDERVAKYMRWPTHTSVAVTKAWLSEEEKQEDCGGFFDFFIFIKRDEKLIGTVGLYEREEAFELGYNLMYDEWGKGYATEAAKRVLLFAIRELGVRRFIANHSVENPKSGSVLKKCGFIRTGEGVDHKFTGEAMNVYQYEFNPDNPTYTLNNGVKIPAIGYGSFLSTRENGYQTVLDALKCGYRYIDTAYFYKNEDEIGKAMKESGVDREELFLCSKVWPTRMGYEETKRCFEDSCKSLGTDYIDLYLIHWPKKSQSDENWVELIRETWRAMEELYEEGKIKAIGLSNFLPHHIRPLLETAKILPAVDQLELHAGYMQCEAVKYCKAHDILVEAWSPLGRGALLQDETVARLAQKYQKSPAQILLKYLYQKQIVIIPKASGIERMNANKDIFDFYLSDDDVSILDSMPQSGFSGEHPDWVEWNDSTKNG